MAKKYLAFLGAGKYLVCHYHYHEAVMQTRFVQVALTRAVCQEWTTADEIVVFTTAEAKSKNWEASSNNDGVGLEDEFSGLQLPCRYGRKHIPDGASEKELWEIFNIVWETLQPEDEILFDMTHAFRSLPLLALIILNYAKILKQCRLLGIYYGAMEALGDYHSVNDMFIADRHVPVFDLTPFVSVLEWTIGIDRFLKTGDASAIASLLTHDAIPRILQTSEGQAIEHAQQLEKIAEATQNFTRNAATCRGQDLSTAALNVQQSLTNAIQASTAFVKPLTPLLRQMQTHFQVFQQQQETANVFQVVHWCLNHGLIQQGLTLLQEVVITDLCQKLQLDAGSYKQRQLVAGAIGILHLKRPEKEAEFDRLHTLQIAQVRALLPDDVDAFLAVFRSLRDTRNDINHGGYGGNRKRADKFQEVLQQTLADLERIYLRRPIGQDE